jgi:Trypsin-co-occurring domain 2
MGHVMSRPTVTDGRRTSSRSNTDVSRIDGRCQMPPHGRAVSDHGYLRFGGLIMTATPEFEGKLGLADFLSDLRVELGEAAKRAEGGALKLEIDQITVSLDVAFTVGRKGEGSAKAGAKFWVFASAEGSVKGELSFQRADTQHLTLTLKPRIEETWVDESGTVQHASRGVDVSGMVQSDEENPEWAAPNEQPPRTASTR